MIIKLYRAAAHQFRSFTDKKEMNQHVSAHIFAAGRKLHKNARAVLNMMAHHSCIITGVSWLNEETIAESIGICPRTVKRAIDRLIMLGIGRREIVNHDGIILRYFVINRFELSLYCPEIDNDLSSVESETSPTASTVEPSEIGGESLETKDLKKHDIVVVEQAVNIIEYPSAIITALSRHNLTVNASTLRRWLSLADQSTVVKVIEYALTRNVRNIIGYITAILMQGYAQPVSHKRNHKRPIKRDILPEWVINQHQQKDRPQHVKELDENQKKQAEELLRALGEID